MTDDGRAVPDQAAVGLCFTCRWMRRVVNRRGSSFFRCTLAETDARFVRYPPLPVLQCEGFENEPDVDASIS